MLKVFCDDGSTAIKLAWKDDTGEKKTLLVPNSLKREWSVELGSKPVFNYMLDNAMFGYDTNTAQPIKTTNLAFQYSDVNLVSIHHALLQTGIEPQPIELWVTLPISEYYTSTMEINQENVDKKVRNLTRKVTRNKGNVFEFVKINVTPESLPSAIFALSDDDVKEYENSLVVDLGGTTLDCGMISGQYESVSKISGDSNIGVSLISEAVMDELKRALSMTSYVTVERLLKNQNDDQLFKTVVNKLEHIEDVKNAIRTSTDKLIRLVCNHVDEHYPAGVSRIYLTGGGANLIFEGIKNNYQHLNEKVKIITNPQFALVNAMIELKGE